MTAAQHAVGLDVSLFVAILEQWIGKFVVPDTARFQAISAVNAGPCYHGNGRLCFAKTLCIHVESGKEEKRHEL